MNDLEDFGIPNIDVSIHGRRVSCHRQGVFIVGTLHAIWDGVAYVKRDDGVEFCTPEAGIVFLD